MSALAFLVAIAVLVVVHEWGHFSVARWCGVKVIRFSVGFGPKLFGWTSRVTGTEFVVGMLPLGGYVKMLDEREAPVAMSERANAFNTQPLRNKAAIVLAGPVANLILAVVLYSCVNWAGIEMAQPIVGKPPQDSVLAAAGFGGGERILRVGFEDEPLEDIASFEDFRWWLARSAIAHRNLQVEFTAPQKQTASVVLLTLGGVDASSADDKLLQKIGAIAPFSQARLGTIVPKGAAEQAHLQTGDVVVRVDDTKIVDSTQLYELIRASGNAGEPHPQTWQIEREGARTTILVTPKLAQDNGKPIGRIGAMVAAPPAMTLVRYGLLDGVERAAVRTWETSTLTLRMMGQIVIGQASLSNVSGPIAIAGYAGKSAALGFTQFLVFLALMSVSLGVLNLLPVPILDGGHLMYYLWEALSGKPVSQLWTERLQKLGLVVLLMMMSVAVMNDVTRLLR
jgi:regulator of sigma E protease